MSPPRETLRLALCQFSPRTGLPLENARRLRDIAATCDADLVVAPELALTGYDVRDAATALAVPARPGDEIPGFEGSTGADLLLGLVERGRQGATYNSAARLRAGRVAFRHRKIYLPTYGMFDEARWFARGDALAVDTLGAWRIGVLVCEDLWHPALPYLLAARGIDALAVLAAAPGRGVWEGGEAGGDFASAAVWQRIARTTAQLYGIYVVLANRAGVEDGITFAGGSCVVGPDGTVLASAPEHGEALLHVGLDRSEVARARSPYAHARDEDLRLVHRELGRILEAGAE
jgi:NAD+ synthase (glutamine-hydrolysing)